MAASVTSSPDDGVALHVTIGLRGFLGRETHGPYPEKNLVLRVWHPAFMEFKYIRHDQLVAASHNGEMTMYEPLVFTQLRQSKYDAVHREIVLPRDALLGLQMFAQTENDSGQDCAKPQGAYWGVLLRNVHMPAMQAPVVTYKSVAFVSECLEGSAVPGARGTYSDGVKASAVELVVYARLVNATARFVPSEFGSLEVARFSDRARSMLHSFVAELRDFHEGARVACEKLRKYYSLQYKIASGIALPASAYMLHMMGPDSVPPSARLVRGLISAALSAHPEFTTAATCQANNTSAADVWVARCEEYLNSARARPPRSPSSDVTFVDCLRVAMHVLTAYPNAVPYLLDMEIDTTGRTKGNPRMYEHATSAMQSGGNAGGTYDESWALSEPVERFACAVMETYGTDCEDFAMYAYWLKNMIQKTYATSTDAVLRTLARVYELFVACVTHMFCKGDDGQGTTDDGVYHFATYMIPRVYMSECWRRGQPAVDVFAERVAGARAWESDYRSHLGVFIIEGTNTVDSAQFRMDQYTENLRETNTQSACAGIRGISRAESQRRINVYHSYVFAKPNQLSGFYRWVLGMFCGEGSMENVIDMAFFGGGTKGARVEDLAAMRDTVEVRQVVRYERAMLKLCRELIDVYRPPYRGLVAVNEYTEPDLVACVLGLAPKVAALVQAPPPTLEQCRRHVRIHLQHLDFSKQRLKRAEELARALEEYAAHVHAKSATVHANILGATWVTACDLCETANGHLHTVVQLFVIFFY